MAIVKRIVKCECGEEFEADITGSKLQGDLYINPWRYVKACGMGNDDDDESVKILFIREIACGKCYHGLVTEQKSMYVKLTKEGKVEYEV